MKKENPATISIAIQQRFRSVKAKILLSDSIYKIAILSHWCTPAAPDTWELDNKAEGM